MTDPYLLWDAASVLGSLSSDERREYETHVSGCEQCRCAVGELSGVPALLSLMGRDEPATESPPMRTQVLDDLLDQVSRRRRRSRVRTWLVSAATAAAVTAVALLIAFKPGPAESVTALAMTQVAPSSLEATVSVSSQGWGTRIEMTCTYRDDPKGVDHDDDTLAMFAVGRDGTRVQLATWTAVDGATATPSGSTSMPVGEIAAVQVVSSGTGDVLLQRNL